MTHAPRFFRPATKLGRDGASGSELVGKCRTSLADDAKQDSLIGRDSGRVKIGLDFDGGVHRIHDDIACSSDDSKTGFSAPAALISDGLGRFTSVRGTGILHEPHATGGSAAVVGPAVVKRSGVAWEARPSSAARQGFR